MEDRRVVIISGFGPFGIHSINPSWESIKIMSKSDLEEKYNIQIITLEVPVVYKDVDEIVPSLWKKYNPMLFIHVGVSAQAKSIILETTANSDNYKRPDCNKKLPPNGMNCSNSNACSSISCNLNIKSICENFNNKFKDISAGISSNAGRYLCEYIYFTSLSIDPGKTLFIHVPDINGSYSLEQTAKGLNAIIELCILQLRDCECMPFNAKT